MKNQDYEQNRPIDILKMRILVFGMGFLDWFSSQIWFIHICSQALLKPNICIQII